MVWTCAVEKKTIYLQEIPQNYIESIQEIYSDMMCRALETGYKSAEIKSKSIKVDLSLPKEELDREIEIKIPMAFGTKLNFVDVFRSEVSTFLESMQPDKVTSIIDQFEKDMNASYLEGVKEYLTVDLPSQDAQKEVSETEEKEEKEEEKVAKERN